MTGALVVEVSARLAAHIRAQRSEIVELRKQLEAVRHPEVAFVDDALDDLQRWRRKATRAVKAGRPAKVHFASAAIPSELHEAISERLSVADSEDRVKAAFSDETLRAATLARLEAAVGAELVARAE